MPSIGSLMERLRRKKEELKRLKKCREELKVTQQSFTNNKNLCLLPELSSQTWLGNWADGFDDIRESGILESYQEIETKQFKVVYKEIAKKIEEIEKEIEELEAQIEALMAM